MGLNFRPVREEWGEFSSVFIDREMLIGLLAAIATEVDTDYTETEYGENTSLWFDNGTKMLNFMEQTLTTEKAAAMLHEVGGDEQEHDHLDALVGNMKLLAAESWRRCVGQHGELVFYVD